MGIQKKKEKIENKGNKRKRKETRDKADKYDSIEREEWENQSFQHGRAHSQTTTHTRSLSVESAKLQK